MFKHPQFANAWSLIKKKLHNFHPLEIVGRGSDTQLQVSENVKRFNG